MKRARTEDSSEKVSKEVEGVSSSSSAPKPIPITRKWRRENAVHNGLPCVIMKDTGEIIPVENMYLKQKQAKAMGVVLPKYEECWICGSQEHRRRDCPKADRRTDGSMIQSTVVCLECRKRGHRMSECPNRTSLGGGPGETSSEGVTRPTSGAPCYRCGEGHHLRDCPAPRRDGSLPFAHCFVCGRQGHLASGCPDNKNGAYPRGGSCKVCGSTAHLAKDCPVEAEAGGREARLAAGGSTAQGSSRGEFARSKWVSRPANPNPEDLGSSFAEEPLKKTSSSEDGWKRKKM